MSALCFSPLSVTFMQGEEFVKEGVAPGRGWGNWEKKTRLAGRIPGGKLLDDWRFAGTPMGAYFFHCSGGSGLAPTRCPLCDRLSLPALTLLVTYRLPLTPLAHLSSVVNSLALSLPRQQHSLCLLYCCKHAPRACICVPSLFFVPRPCQPFSLTGQFCLPLLFISRAQLRLGFAGRYFCVVIFPQHPSSLLRYVHSPRSDPFLSSTSTKMPIIWSSGCLSSIALRMLFGSTDDDVWQRNSDAWRVK